MQPKAVIFDLDGVLTNTAHYHFLAWKELADSLGYKFDINDNERLKGVDRLTSFEIILEINNALDKYTKEEKIALANKKNDYYKSLILKMTKDDILDGIEPFLEDLRKAGIKTGVASISKNAQTVLDVLKINDKFDYIADAAKITKSKPDPEIFAVCAEELGVAPEDCIGIEDAQAGIQSIHGAGMFSVGINVDVTCLEPDLHLKSTSELSFDKICDAYTNWRN